MKALLLICLLIATPLIARDQDDQVAKDFEIEKENIYKQERDEREPISERLSIFSTAGFHNRFANFNRQWSNDLSKFQKVFTDDSERSSWESNDANLRTARQARQEYDKRREQANDILAASNNHIDALKDSEYYKLLDAPTKRTLDSQLVALEREIKNQEEVWKPLGWFDSKDTILSKLTRAERSIDPVADLANQAMQTWSGARGDLQLRMNDEYKKAQDELDSHRDKYSDVATLAFQSAIQNNIQAGDFNDLKSQLILKDVNGWAREMGLSVNDVKRLILNDTSLNKAMSETPMGIYVNRQIARAMGGLCNQVAQCTKETNSAQKAFTDMFKFLDDSNRGASPRNIPDMEIDDALIKSN